MNVTKLSFFLMLALSFSACKKDGDDMATCTQSDWVGTYEGTISCDDGSMENVTLTITADGTDAIVIKYVSSTVTTEFDPLTPSGCDLDFTASDIGLTVTVDATLDGDDLDMDETFSDGTTSATCTITATRI
jgi:hypothetical protein